MIYPPYIIVQAGGKGTRLKQYTANKPKAMVSIDNLPMIFHLFRKYPDSKFVIIGDYMKDVLDRYLDAFCDVQYVTVDAGGYSGTCSGISNALSCIPGDEPFMLIWSDLILGKAFDIPDLEKEYVGISGNFRCRWSYVDEEGFVERPSEKDGVAGLFIFKSRESLSGVPSEGEFVIWLQQKKMHMERLLLGNNSAEYGLVESIKLPEFGKCRPFNHMRIEGDRVIKEGIDEQGRKLAVREKEWYSHVAKYDVAVPKIYSYEPFTMERIRGKNVYGYDLSEREKDIVLKKIMIALSDLHKHNLSPPDYFSMYEAYYLKTVNRLSKVRGLMPFANSPYITINGKKCRNVFFHLDELRDKVKKLSCGHFCLIHGDCTFSNILLKGDTNPVFIDPRGYFGHSEIVGDPQYDWAKLYYSLYGDYDMFNLGRFDLKIEEDSVELNIETNGWKNTESDFISLLPDGIDIVDIRLIHAIIWLSLTTYAWNDYDSVCGAFYNGLYYLEDVL